MTLALWGPFLVKSLKLVLIGEVIKIIVIFLCDTRYTNLSDRASVQAKNRI